MSHQLIKNKIRPEHLERRAYVYVRQSTLHQVRENTTSTQRQYDLTKLASDLGWEHGDIVVVDQDQARSGASVERRDGFKGMLSEIALGNVGAVISLEASRLARDSSAWHQLLKICDVTNTLIVDELGIYDPRDRDDRLLLGFKGTLSEAESCLIHSRMVGAKRIKAKAGTLGYTPAVGFVGGVEGKITIDPDEEIQSVIRLLFDMFDRHSSVRMLVREFNDRGLKFPTRNFGKTRIGEIQWLPLRYNRALAVLKNPAYAGAYVYGRTKYFRDVDVNKSGEIRTRVRYVNRDDWDVLIVDHHQGYITWDKYNLNQRRIQENRNRRSADTLGAVRAGSALLQGLIICGNCGRRVQVAYPKGRRNPLYFCMSKQVEYADFGYCIRFSGRRVDEAVAEVFLDAMKPAHLRLSIGTIERLEAETRRVSKQWELRLEKSQYEAELARRRFEAVDPDNRLVARTLEKDWNAKLTNVESVRREMGEAIELASPLLTPTQRKAVMALAKDLPLIWCAETTTQIERKQLLRFLIKDVTVTRDGKILSVNIRWQTGAWTCLDVLLKRDSESSKTSSEIVDIIRNLSATHNDRQIADHLNNMGLRPKRAARFRTWLVTNLRVNNGIKQGRAAKWQVRTQREDGRVSVGVAVKLLKLSKRTLYQRCKRGMLDAVRETGRYNRWWIRLPDNIVGEHVVGGSGS